MKNVYASVGTLGFLFWLLSSCVTTKTNSLKHPFDGDQLGCGSFIAFKLSADKRQVVSVAVNMTGIDVEPSQNFRIGDTDVVEVKWKVYDGDIGPSLCNDLIGQQPDLLEERIADGGLLEILVGEEEIKKQQRREPYKVTLVIRRATFDELRIDYLKVEALLVGWLPG